MSTITTTERDLRVIGLVGIAHCGSHFFQLVLPPLFPLLAQAFGVGYTELGLVMTCFFAASGLAQTPAGFLVDRHGAPPILAGGLFLLGLGALLAAFAPGYWALLPVAVLMGVGNCVFHPADYSILSHHVAPSRMARAFSVHTVGGTLGWAVAPIVMAAIGTMISWRVALLVAATIGLVLAALVFVERRELATPAHRASGSQGAAGPGLGTALRLFLTAPILLCFGFFVLQAGSFISVQSFMPLALRELYGLPVVLATSTVTAFMLGSAVGTLAGGVLADRTGRLAFIIAGGLGLGAAVLLLVGYLALPYPALLAVVAVAGAFMGLTTPSRDMLVRAAAPKGASGRTFGFVYSGLDLGATVAPALAGLLLDHGLPRGVFVFVAIVTLLSILTATNVPGNRPAPAAVPAE